jgi:hypothetical protein
MEGSWLATLPWLLALATTPLGGVISDQLVRGLGIEVDEDKVARYHGLYRERGQFLPRDPTLIW